MIRPFAALLALGLLFSGSMAVRCRSYQDCDDYNPSTMDVCMPSGDCVNIILENPSTTVRQNSSVPGIFFVTKEDLIATANAVPIPLADRKQTLRIMAAIAAEYNPHRFLHLKLLKFDPVKAYTDLSSRLDTENLTNVEFLSELGGIFQQMDDLHTVFTSPEPLRSAFAVLGVAVKQFYEPGGAGLSSPPKERYVLVEIVSEVNVTDFVPGVELVEWNGLPIGDVVRELGVKSYGANPAARLQRGLDNLATRILGQGPFPDEDAVEVKYQNLDGKESTISIPWIYGRIGFPTDGNETATATGTVRQGYTRNVEQLTKEDMHKLPAHHLGWFPKTSLRVSTGNRIFVAVTEPTVFAALQAEIIETSVGSIGRIVLESFPTATVPVLEEYARVIGLMPRNGLIVDIRGNNGGDPDTVKIILNLLSSIRVPELSFNIRATDLTEKLILAPDRDVSDIAQLRTLLYDRFYKPFQAALRDALLLGEMFTGAGGGFLTDLGKLRPAPVYDGPFIVVSDAKTYSGGDIFASYAVDTGVAELVGVANATGGGGASTVSYEFVQAAFPTLLEPLPVGSFASSYSRYYRTGEKAGSIVENFGVTPDIMYYPTFTDVFGEDCELFEFLAERLVAKGDGGGEIGSSPEPDVSPEIGPSQEPDVSPEAEEIVV